MVSQTKEQVLETCIETTLVEGACYEKGEPADLDPEVAIDCDLKPSAPRSKLPTLHLLQSPHFLAKRPVRSSTTGNH